MSKRPFNRSARLTFVAAILTAIGLIPAAACIDLGADSNDSEAAAITAGGVSATLTFASDWGAGYCANITVTNGNASSITGWSVTVSLNQSTFANGWSANNFPASSASGQFTATNASFNGALGPNGSASFGFCGNATGSNYHATLVSVSATGASGGTGAGGTTGSGGTTGTGGTKATGGTTGTGGATGTGGVKATGGTTGTGGATGSGGTSGSASLATHTGAASTCTQFGTIDGDGKAYWAMNNIWNPTGAGTQCISWSGTTLSVTSTSFSNTGAAPSSYPAFVRGCHFGNCSNNWTAKQVSAIGSAPSTFSVSPSTAGGPWDIAYDIWLDPTNNNSGQQTGLELMIWLDYTGSQPSGTQIGTATIDGQSWEVWAARMSSWNYVAYRAKGLRSVNIDVKHFLNDVIANRQVNGQPAASAAWFLTSIQAGSEIWQGGSGFSASFSAAVN